MDNLFHPKFNISIIPLPKISASLNEDRFRVSITESNEHYYIAINSTIFAVWQGAGHKNELDLINLLADNINICHGTAGHFTDNYLFFEENSTNPETKEVLPFDAVLSHLGFGGNLSAYIDQRSGIYD